MDVVNAALSLGIRLSSDADMLWIVYEMLDAPLPPNWQSYVVEEKDEYGEVIEGGQKYTVRHILKLLYAFALRAPKICSCYHVTIL